MIEHKLSNVLLKPADHLKGHDELYAFCSSPLVYDETAEALVVGEPTDFMTFLNACSTGKWAKYCGIHEVTLSLELSGDACEVVIKGLPAGAAADAESTVELDRLAVEPEQGAHARVSATIDAAGMDLVAFELLPAGQTLLHAGSYAARVDEDRVRPVRIALSTTTFKKEHYIVPNIELMRASVAEDSGPIHDNFHMFVVDNGQTLDAEALSDELVTVIPNANVGGAGGFARGMLAALDSKEPFTHVILMDDDVHVFPESIKRTYNLLALASDEYADAFVNGAMLSVEQPTRLFEDVSHVLRSGKYAKLKPDHYVDRLDQVVANERENVEVEHAYGAWWFSCIPVDCYQYVRNFLVMAACDGFVNTELFMSRVWRNVMLRRRDLEYGAAELLLQGVEDYLRGPEWLMEVDGSALMRKNAQLNDRFVPLADIDPELLDAANLDAIHPEPHHAIGLAGKLRKTLPYDKHLLPDALLKKAPGHMQTTGPCVYDNDTIARKTVLVLDVTGEKAAVRRMDRERNRRIIERERALKRRWQLEHEKVAAAYADAFPTMRSEAYWRRRLGME